MLSPAKGTPPEAQNGLEDPLPAQKRTIRARHKGRAFLLPFTIEPDHHPVVAIIQGPRQLATSHRMNFLAHLALAGPSDASRIGNLLGDFEKGTPASIRERLPAPIVEGIVMHRHIDRFTDSHPVFHQARLLLAPERRRFAGIIIDIYFDHLLNKHWASYHPGTVPEFTREIYQTFDRHPDWLGPRLGPLVPRIKREDWLAAYSTMDGIDLTLHRVASRSPRLSAIATATPDLIAGKEALEALFLRFYPEIRQYAAELLGKKTILTPAFP